MSDQPLDLRNVDYSRWRVVHLRTGEFLLAADIRPNLLNQQYYVMNHPIKVVMMPCDDGSISVGLLKWNPYTQDEDYNILCEHVLTVSTMTMETVAYYAHALKKEKEDQEESLPAEEKAKKEYDQIEGDAPSEIPEPKSLPKEEIKKLIKNSKKKAAKNSDGETIN